MGVSGLDFHIYFYLFSLRNVWEENLRESTEGIIARVVLVQPNFKKNLDKMVFL